MTTIAYHGPSRTICSDSLVTRGAGAAKARLEAVVKVECLKRFKLPRCKGERMVALAYAGSLQGMENATRFALHNFKSWRGAEEIFRREGVTLEGLNGTAMLLFTDKSVYGLRVDNGRLSYNEYDLDAHLTLGSGGMPALTAMKVYGASPRDAVVAAALVDDGTGVIIHTHRIAKDGLIYELPEVISTEDSTRLQLRKNAAKSKDMPKIKKPKPGEPITSILPTWTEDSETIKQVRESLVSREKNHQKRLKEAREKRKAKKAPREDAV